MDVEAARILGTLIGAGLAMSGAIGAGIGVGLVVQGAVQAMGRNPDFTPTIQPNSPTSPKPVARATPSRARRDVTSAPRSIGPTFPR